MIDIPVALITGGSDGVGAALAIEMARNSKKPLIQVVCGQHLQKLTTVTLECARLGTAPLAVEGDLRQEKSCRQLIDLCMDRFGRIDTLVCNPDITDDAFLETVPHDRMNWFEDMMRINFWSNAWCIHAALPYLRQNQGRLVAISSLAGLMGMPGHTAYCASKFALGGFLEALRTEIPSQELSITVAYPGLTQPAEAQNERGASGWISSRLGLNLNHTLSLQECASLIHRGMLRRDREVMLTQQGRLWRWLKLIAPAHLDHLIQQKMQPPTNR